MTTKPPTTLPVPSATAASETIRSQVGWPGIPATMIAPTMTIPWIAFVPDISGVCSSVGTFEITCTPRKAARIRTVSSIRKPAVHAGRLRSFSGDAGAGGDLVLEVEDELALGREVVEQRLDVARVEPARVGGHLARQVESGRRS